MTQCKKLGYKVGQRFRNDSMWFAPGEEIVLVGEAYSRMPLFKGRHELWYVDLDYVRPIYRIRANTNEVIDV